MKLTHAQLEQFHNTFSVNNLQYFGSRIQNGGWAERERENARTCRGRAHLQFLTCSSFHVCLIFTSDCPDGSTSFCFPSSVQNKQMVFVRNFGVLVFLEKLLGFQFSCLCQIMTCREKAKENFPRFTLSFTH